MGLYRFDTIPSIDCDHNSYAAGTPFHPMPHLVEKLIMLKNGTLQKPIDIFDLFFHLIPLILLCLKFVRSYLKT